MSNKAQAIKWQSNTFEGHTGKHTDADLKAAQSIAANVEDPELPFLTLTDLGILRSVELEDGVIVAKVSPTYSGCPAVDVIEQSVQQALQQAGFNARVERVMTPAWTTDWITNEGRKKLISNGIAPPDDSQADSTVLFSQPSVNCPQCQSNDTAKISEFGSTPCKAQYQCNDCSEPFDYFKCH